MRRRAHFQYARPSSPRLGLRILLADAPKRARAACAYLAPTATALPFVAGARLPLSSVPVRDNAAAREGSLACRFIACCSDRRSARCRLPEPPTFCQCHWWNLPRKFYTCAAVLPPRMLGSSPDVKWTLNGRRTCCYLLTPPLPHAHLPALLHYTAVPHLIANGAYTTLPSLPAIMAIATRCTRCRYRFSTTSRCGRCVDGGADVSVLPWRANTDARMTFACLSVVIRFYLPPAFLRTHMPHTCRYANTAKTPVKFYAVANIPISGPFSLSVSKQCFSPGMPYPTTTSTTPRIFPQEEVYYYLSTFAASVHANLIPRS